MAQACVHGVVNEEVCFIATVVGANAPEHTAVGFAT